jgi:hypothetical protein
MRFVTLSFLLLPLLGCSGNSGHPASEDGASEPKTKTKTKTDPAPLPKEEEEAPGPVVRPHQLLSTPKAYQGKRVKVTGSAVLDVMGSPPRLTFFSAGHPVVIALIKPEKQDAFTTRFRDRKPGRPVYITIDALSEGIGGDDLAALSSARLLPNPPDPEDSLAFRVRPPEKAPATARSDCLSVSRLLDDADRYEGKKVKVQGYAQLHWSADGKNEPFLLGFASSTGRLGLFAYLAPGTEAEFTRKFNLGPADDPETFVWVAVEGKFEDKADGERIGQMVAAHLLP